MITTEGPDYRASRTLTRLQKFESFPQKQARRRSQGLPVITTEGPDYRASRTLTRLQEF